MSKEKRLDDILNLIAQNPALTRDQITTQLNSRPDITQKTGDESEERVKGVLESLDFIKLVRQTSHGGWEDRDGKDFVVYFERNTFVSVQVKSSDAGIKIFMEEHHLSAHKLLTRKLILLNGQDIEDRIRQKFIDDLKKVNNFWKNERRETLLPPELLEDL